MNNSLLNRLEAADGPDWELFREVMKALLTHDDHQELINFIYECVKIGAWESAALALVREVLPGWKAGVCEMWKTPGWKASLLKSKDFEELGRTEGVHKSIAIALLIALLSATSQEAGE